MELRNIITFLRITELEQFSKAAAELGYAQSTVTTQIRQLEEELEHPLFNRLGNKVELTHIGQEFLPLAQKMYNTMQEIQTLQQDQRQIRGLLRVGVVESFFYSGMIDLLSDFQRRYPEVEIQLFTDSSTQVQDMLVQNQVDLICCMKDNQNIIDERIDILYSKEFECIFVAGVSSSCASDRLYTLKELSGMSFFLTEENSIYHRELHRMFYSAGLTLRHGMSLQSIHAIRKLLKLSGGISFLPEYTVKKDLKSQELHKVNVTFDIDPFCCIVGCNRSKWISPPIQAFIDILMEENWV